MADLATILNVWRQPDEAYRFPVLRMFIGDTELTTVPPEFVKEITLGLSSSHAVHDLSVVLYDASWVAIPALLGLNVNDQRQSLMSVQFGWSFEGGVTPVMAGEITGMKENVTPEGIEYTLRGYVGVRPKISNDPNWKRPYLGKISEIAAHFATVMYGIPEDKQIIEPTTGKADDRYSVAESHAAVEMYLAYLAKKARPAVRVIPEGYSEDDAQKRGLFGYTFFVDTDGYFHFHTLAYAIAKQMEDPQEPVPLTWPYPGDGNPVIDVDIADVEFNNVRLIASGIDPVNPDPEQDTVKSGSGDNAVDYYVTPTPGRSAAWLELVDATQANMAKRSFTTDVTMMGNPFISFGTVLDMSIVGGDLRRVEAISHLSGSYVVKQVVHSVAEDSYVTRCNATKYYSGE